MWVQVQFKCDNKVQDLDISYLKDFETIKEELQRHELRKEYFAFWSPDSEESPQSLLEREKKILIVDNIKKTSSKSVGPIAGYYAAKLLHYADTLDDLLLLLGNPENRRALAPNKTASTVPLTKREKNKASKQVAEKARLINLQMSSQKDDEVVVSKESNSSSDSQQQTQLPLRSRGKKMSTVKRNSKANHSDEEDDDDELVPDTMLKEAQSEIKRLQSYIHKLNSEIDELREKDEAKDMELKEVKSSVLQFKTECEDLKVKNNKLLDLNAKWQEKELSKSRHHSSRSRSKHSSSTSAQEKLMDEPLPKKMKEVNGTSDKNENLGLQEKKIVRENKDCEDSPSRSTCQRSENDNLMEMNDEDISIFDDDTPLNASLMEKDTRGLEETAANNVHKPVENSDFPDLNGTHESGTNSSDINKDSSKSTQSIGTTKKSLGGICSSGNLTALKRTKGKAAKGGLQLEEDDYTLKPPEGVSLLFED